MWVQREGKESSLLNENKDEERKSVEGKVAQRVRGGYVHAIGGCSQFLFFRSRWRRGFWGDRIAIEITILIVIAKILIIVGWKF